MADASAPFWPGHTARNWSPESDGFLGLKLYFGNDGVMESLGVNDDFPSRCDCVRRGMIVKPLAVRSFQCTEQLGRKLTHW